ncbi:glucoamylase family protein [Rufibacter sp. XAAS-G3-1]|uniref:glucoamylase family protein n=1 Tax=Rufibacter sp. XAAS-G3-1 TaxID=2729134 RepID=UPI0015E77E87|nr:glucoamylase family protein [Rufibacter sp. XAAS-G3-1]
MLNFAKQLPLVLIALLCLGGSTQGCKENDAPLPDQPQTLAPSSTAEDKQLLDQVQRETFKYFWDFAHPASGMARERTTSGDMVTSGGSGFGVQALVVGADRGFVTRAQAVDRLHKICDFLASADRFHGVWSHWINGNTGKVMSFSQKDNGGDVIETAFLVNGLLTARAYFNGADAREAALRTKITQLWETVEWDWYASRGDNLLYWHWSPTYGWDMNMPIRGWNEGLIAHVLALSSPTHPVSATVYRNTWTSGGPFRNGNTYEGYTLDLGERLGGPLFFSHYSFISLDPRQLQDQYTNYWRQNVTHTLINRSYSLHTAPKHYGYSASLWGLTASDTYNGYTAHSPTNDNGTVSPTAALSSFPYTPYYSMQVLRHLYKDLNTTMIGPYGPYDAYNKSRNWVGTQNLAIDQGPIVTMIENYRSGLLWSLFTNLPEIQAGLAKANLSKPVYETGFPLAVPEVQANLVDLLKHPDADAYQLEVAVNNAPGLTLTVEKGDGTVVETIWTNETKANGLHTVRFGKTLPPATYRLRLKNASVNKTLTVFLH